MKINVEKSSIKEWLNLLSEASRGKHYPKLWKRVHGMVAVTERRRHEVNLSKLERYTKEGDNVIVPGKILSKGELTHKVRIAAIEYSAPALKSLRESDCKIVSLKEMLNSEKIKVIT